MTDDKLGAAGTLTVLDETGSTNDDVHALAAQGAPAGTAVAARRQTDGRGRRGHAWDSPEGGLYLSVLVRPDVPMGCFTGLPAVCSLAVLATLRRELGLERAMLKWPNDVTVDGGKLAGVLVEARSGEQGPYAVCGIGVNLSPSAPAADEGRAFAGARPLPRVCAADLVPDRPLPPFEDLARALSSAVDAAVVDWCGAVRAGRAAAGPLAPVLGAYFDALDALGSWVTVVSPEGLPRAEGTFAGVDCWGRATVVLADGTSTTFASEQASLRRAVPV